MGKTLITDPQVEGRRRISMPPNLTMRVLTAAVGVPVTLLMVGLGGWLLFSLALVIGVLAQLEFFLLARSKVSRGSRQIGIAVIVLGLWLAQYAVTWPWFGGLLAGAILFVLLLALVQGQRHWRALGWRLLITVAGVAYVGLPLVAMLRVREAADDGALWLLLILVITWVTDSASYFTGRIWGKRMLAARISPKKTREGAIGGWVAGALAGFLLLQVTGLYSAELWPLLILAPLLAIVGDLWESGLKRYFQKKDSRLVAFNLFPGHGGVLDRIDSLLFVAPGVVLYLAAVTAVFA